MARATKPQIIDPARRTPRQKRARASVEAILEAAARILEAEGMEALNTNRIAERAGVSVGTLYQYFPNKGAILLAMGQRETARLEAEVTRRLGEGLPGDGSAARAVIRTLIGAFGSRRRVRRVVLEAMMSPGQNPMRAVPMQRIGALIAPDGAGWPVETRTALFVMTRAVVGVIRAAVLEESPLLGEPSFEDALVALATGTMQRLKALQAQSAR
jgi:AcrR family transcriptional regulator